MPPVAGERTERRVCVDVNMDAVANVNSTFAIVYNFINGPDLSGVVKATLENDEDNTAVILRTAGDEHRQLPVRVDGYVDFVVPRYAEATFKEHFRLQRSTFQVRLLSSALGHM